MKTRSFLAILLPKAVRENIYRVSLPFRQLPLDVKWVEEQNYHLTLKFMGALTATEIQLIKDTLSRLVLQPEGFMLSYGGCGVFPNLRYPRIIWLGLSGEVERLRQLAARIERELGRAGFPAEKRPFRPHLTLGRFRSATNLELFRQTLQEHPVPERLGDFRVAELHLMASNLTPEGPHYTSLAAFRLS